MFSDELRELVDMTLVDGRLDENEKKVLIKRAQAEGADIAELELYIQALLQKRNIRQQEDEMQQAERTMQQRKEAMGGICPMCGRQLRPMAVMCDCGYIIQQSRRSQAVADLSAAIENANRIEPNERKRTKMIVSIVNTAVVPSTEQDIIEFLDMAAANSQLSGGWFNQLKNRRLVCFSLFGFLVLLSSVILVDEFTLTKLLYSFLFTLFMFALFFSWSLVPLLYLAFTRIGGSMLLQNEIALAWRNKANNVLYMARGMNGDKRFNERLSHFSQVINR